MTKKTHLLACLLIHLITIGQSELIFNTGFENGITLSSTSPQFSIFTGTDITVPPPNNFLNFENHSNIGVFRIYYEEGNSSQRIASITNDPVNPINKVLNFKILEPHINIPLTSQYSTASGLVDKKCRIQTELYGCNNLKEIYQSIRLFIPNDLNNFVNSPYPSTGDWIIPFEFWNNAQWVNPNYNFRIHINLVKGEAITGSPLFFQLEGQTQTGSTYTTIWENTNETYPVPIGNWVTIEYYIKEGIGNAGRFYFSIKPDGLAKTVLFDVNNSTCHPDDPNPDGFSEINPIKLYCSNNVVTKMNSFGGTFQLFWDDFKFWKNLTPEQAVLNSTHFNTDNDIVTIYPIPNKGEIINFKSIKTIENIKIIDVLGKVIFEAHNDDSFYRLNTNQFNKDIYTAIIEIDGQLIRKKIAIN